MVILGDKTRHVVSYYTTLVLHQHLPSSRTRGDFCTIRSAGLTTVIDGVCPRGDATCYGLHANHIAPSGPTVSQEWNLLSLTSVQSGSVQQSPAISLPRRPLLLQNVLTGTLATRAENTTGPNVSLTQSVLPASTWTIIYSGIKDSLQMDCFCLATSSTTPLTLDHYGGSHINVRCIMIRINLPKLNYLQ